MKITIICIGKLSKDFQKIFTMYQKRINFFANLNIIELKENNHKNIVIQKQKETEQILQHLPKNSITILCSLVGQQDDSKNFTKWFENSNITFVIGGSHGVEEKHFPHKIAFSKMTFPHQLFRIMLIEQIYRAFTIKKFINYHK